MPGNFQYDSPLVFDSDQAFDAYSPSATPVAVTVLPHLAASMNLQPDGSFAFWQQDTIDEVTQSVEMVCGSLQGSRTVVPSFGLPDQAFTIPDPNIIPTQINAFEKRAALTISISTSDNGTSSVKVGVSLAKKGTF